jgi:hypothetical protein
MGEPSTSPQPVWSTEIPTDSWHVPYPFLLTIGHYFSTMEIFLIEWQALDDAA